MREENKRIQILGEGLGIRYIRKLSDKPTGFSSKKFKNVALIPKLSGFFYLLTDLLCHNLYTKFYFIPMASNSPSRLCSSQKSFSRSSNWNSLWMSSEVANELFFIFLKIIYLFCILVLITLFHFSSNSSLPYQSVAPEVACFPST